ncbi:hypothetical protein ILUMI_19613 [Ignelater luminosus]|uniref:HTH psq-type domain-containing protein n=1 Tax=Ignelater luminosus TaxID=2038154 RepID=A0A8K0FZQ8_IGNLU|nr:hypothetical protein ILUMI_19613 [Ignelater luminosus]
MRLYKRTSNRQNWFQKNMAYAIETCVTGRMRYQKAASQFNVPRSTLRNIIKVLVLTEQNGARHNLAKDLQQAETDWAREFLKQHPQLFLRSPEATSTSRAMGFNRTSVKKFFDCLIDVCNEHHFTPARIFNCDLRFLKIKGQLVTARMNFSAAGQYIPPVLIFAQAKDETRIDEWDTTWSCFSMSPEWLDARRNRHFIDLVKPTAEDPVLLLLPFDVEFMAPLSKYYGQEIKVWLRLNRVVTQLQVAKLLDSAYAATAATAMNEYYLLFQNRNSESETADATRLDEHIAKNRQTPPLSSSVAHEIVNYKETVNDDSLLGSSNSSFTITPKNICLVPKEQASGVKRDGRPVIEQCGNTRYGEQYQSIQLGSSATIPDGKAGLRGVSIQQQL